MIISLGRTSPGASCSLPRLCLEEAVSEQLLVLLGLAPGGYLAACITTGPWSLTQPKAFHPCAFSPLLYR